MREPDKVDISCGCLKPVEKICWRAGRDCWTVRLCKYCVGIYRWCMSLVRVESVLVYAPVLIFMKHCSDLQVKTDPKGDGYNGDVQF